VLTIEQNEADCYLPLSSKPDRTIRSAGFVNDK
jgi:hypothetical protein